MSEKWGDRYVSEDVGLVAEQVGHVSDRLDYLDVQLKRIADVLEFVATTRYGYGSSDPRFGCCSEAEGFDIPCSAHATRFAADGRPVA